MKQRIYAIKAQSSISKMSLKYISVLLLMVMLRATVLAQSDATGISNFSRMVDFLPPGPDAAALTKAGIFSLNKNTGAASINLPVMDLTGRKLHVPVSLNYTGTGIKVDEQASRSGLGWVLNCGGVVTRTIRGGPDELSTRVSPWAPIGYNWSTYNFIRAVISASGNGASSDGEPDLFNFNFNGYSGSFVLDNQMQVMQIPKSNLRVEYNFNSPDWNIKITTPDGIRYYFGGSNATEQSKRLTKYGKTFDQYHPTAWYLKKIEHLNGEVISFSYDATEYQTNDAISESMDYIELKGGDNSYCAGGPGPQGIITNRSSTRVQGVLLRNVNTSAFGALRINYVNRRRSLEKLIESVQFYDQTTGDTLKRYKFYYTQYEPVTSYSSVNSVSDAMPYLAGFKVCSGDSTTALAYGFNYIDPAGRPPRLCYSQDHWGYFNGQNNLYFCPKPDDDYTSFFSYATASREPNFQYGVKGMLSRINYPTGGYDSITYEPTFIKYTYNPRTRLTISGDVTGTGIYTKVSNTYTFSLTDNQKITLNNSTHCSDPDCQTIHQVSGRVEILNSAGTSVLDKTYTPETGENLLIPLYAGDYTLRISANGAVLTTSCVLTYNGPLQPAVTIDKAVGGIRVKNLISSSPGQAPFIKRYYYKIINSLPEPSYLSHFRTTSTSLAGGSDGTISVEVNCWADHVGLYANSLTSLFDYGASMTSYGQVTESNGENYENGGTETNYFIQQDAEAATIMGSDIVLNGAKTNYSISYNGKLKSENIIKRLPDDSKIVVKSTSYHYKEDPRAYRELSGYLASQNGTTVYLPDTTINTNNVDWIKKSVDQYALKQYYIISPWVYPDTVKQITYDENGLNPVSETSVNYYDNINHLQVTRVESVNSKGELIRKQNKYPEDFTSLSPYAEMVANNMTGQVVESKDFNNNVETAATRVHYKKWDNNNFDVDSLLKSYRGGPYQQEGVITKRDSAGNVLEYTNKNSIENSVLWGYKRTYPVALIKGTNYAQVISSLSISESALQNLTNVQLESAVNNLRNARTQITSYLYKPLTGVIGVTDTKGLTTSYEYDNFQRLKDVKDKDGKVIRHTDYHYQGQ